jgi:hypothetical protein
MNTDFSKIQNARWLDRESDLPKTRRAVFVTREESFRFDKIDLDNKIKPSFKN